MKKNHPQEEITTTNDEKNHKFFFTICFFVVIQSFALFNIIYCMRTKKENVVDPTILLSFLLLLLKK